MTLHQLAYLPIMSKETLSVAMFALRKESLIKQLLSIAQHVRENIVHSIKRYVTCYLIYQSKKVLFLSGAKHFATKIQPTICLTH